MMMWTLLDAAVFAAGYAASIYSWPRIELWIHGTETEIANLEARAAAIRAAAIKAAASETAAVKTAVVKAAAAATPVAATSATAAPASKATP